jgi:hypothetical protein
MRQAEFLTYRQQQLIKEEERKRLLSQMKPPSISDQGQSPRAMTLNYMTMATNLSHSVGQHSEERISPVPTPFGGSLSSQGTHRSRKVDRRRSAPRASTMSRQSPSVFNTISETPDNAEQKERVKVCETLDIETKTSLRRSVSMFQFRESGSELTMSNVRSFGEREGLGFLATPPCRSIVQRILSFLELPQVVVCFRVCVMWSYFAHDKSFWRLLYQSYEKKLKSPNEKANMNIWEAPPEDKHILVDNDGNIRYATLNGLVEHLTPAESIPNSLDAETVINMYQSFTTASELVRKLFERYNVPPPEGGATREWERTVMRPIQVRVCQILKQLVSLKFSTLDTPLLHLIKIIARIMDDRLGMTLQYTIMKEERNHRQRATSRMMTAVHSISSPHQSSVAAPVISPTLHPHTALKESMSSPEIYISNSSHVERKENSNNSGNSHILKERENTVTQTLSRTIAKPHTKLSHPLKHFLQLKPEQIAQQLTLIDFEIYAEIKPEELQGESWSKKNRANHSSNIRRMIDHFNFLTAAIATSILNEERLRSRVKIFVKWIKVAQYLRKYNNYHTLMAVLAGLNDAPIFRLKHTKEEIPEKWQKVWDELQELMNDVGSFANYRKALSASHPPCIPYIGIYLRDLTYFESNTNEPPAIEGAIKFKQTKQVFSVIKLLQTYQKHPYTEFERNEEVRNLLLSLPALPSTELFKLSNEREPKGAKRAEIR